MKILNSKALSIVMLALVAVLAITWYTSKDNPSHQLLNLSEAPKGGNFTLDSTQGKVSLNDFKDKVVFLYFGYTYCPDICPTNFANITAAYNELTPDEQEQLQVIFISVDPERDDVARLQQYVGFFNENFLGITGTPKELETIARQYGAVYNKVEDGTDYYAVDHSAFTYVIDKQGKLIEQLPHAAAPQEFINSFNNLK